VLFRIKKIYGDGPLVLLLALIGKLIM